MREIGPKNPNASLNILGIQPGANVFWNQPKEVLIEESIKRGMAVLTDAGAIAIETGKFTGRSPKDRFIVKDTMTAASIDWNAINKPFDSDAFDALYDRVTKYLSENKDLFVRDAIACADPDYATPIRVVTEYPWSNQFVYNMFLRPSRDQIRNFKPDWTVLCAPGFRADPGRDGTRQANFSIINLSKKRIVIGGSGYTGEIKKGVFSVLNYILPHQMNVMSMHCSANVGQKGDAAVFFGLSGTGKTTLSADPNRFLIGDDEHGWSDNGIFNFEGGCYAKTINLTEDKEPEIYRAIKHGAILENIRFYEGTRIPNYEDDGITPNTRVSYPIYHIENALPGSKSGHPTNIFFLTADAFGVLPPISKLTPGQAMYHFISGYTAKVAGTEEGVKEPQETFSACFGAPFMPLHPTRYAEMLGERIEAHKVNVWLVNTGWTGGPYGVGSRIKLSYTRAMITAALEGKLNKVGYQKHEVFGLPMPTSCPNVPDELLSPRNTWTDHNAYDQKAEQLARAFVLNFEQFASEANKEIMAASPRVISKT